MEARNRLMESYPQLMDIPGRLVEIRSQLMDAFRSKIKYLPREKGRIHQLFRYSPTTFWTDGPGSAARRPSPRSWGSPAVHYS